MSKLVFSTKDQNIFFTSDTHFNHKNIIKYCKRPFESVDEMNEAIIANWNSVVKENDIVFHLGDFCFCKTEKFKEIISRLNGRIYLVRGNHDNEILKYKEYFESINYQMKISVNDQIIYLNHFPFLCFDGSYKCPGGTWQLFGHVHSGTNDDSGLDCRRLINLFPTQYDVGVDNNNYTPVSYEQVKEIIDEQVLSQNLYRETKTEN